MAVGHRVRALRGRLAQSAHHAAPASAADPEAQDRRADRRMAVARVLFMAGWLAYWLSFGRARAGGIAFTPPLLTLAALAGAAHLLRAAARPGERATGRRACALVFDQLFIAATLLPLGEAGRWLLPVSALVAIANGLHFGRIFGLGSAALGAAGCVFAWAFGAEPGAPAAEFPWVSILWLLLIPGYVSLAGAKITSLSEGYRERARRMARIALEDPLTGLANRLQFSQQLERAIRDARQGEHVESFAVIYCDLDNFKTINDTHGHPVGDLLLQQVAEALRRSVRGTDVVARLGGDEFAVYLRGIADVEIVRRIGRSIVEEVRAIAQVEQIPVQIACSVGISMFRAPLRADAQVDQVLACADAAMFEAKRAGKNQFCLQWATA